MVLKYYGIFFIVGLGAGALIPVWLRLDVLAQLVVISTISIGFCRPRMTGSVVFRDRFILGVQFLLLAVTVAWMGGVLSQLTLQQRIQDQIPASMEGQTWRVAGSVESVIAAKPGATSQRFNFRGAKTPSVNHVFADKLIRVSWRVDTTHKPFELKGGDEWHLCLRVKRPRGLVNPGGFDYQAWLLARKYAATAYVRATDASCKNKKIASHHDATLPSLRHAIQHRLFSNPHLQFQRFFVALLIGETGYLTALDWDVLRRTGTIHLMAISGLHIGLIAMMMFVVGRFLAMLLGLAGHSLWWLAPSLSWLGAGFYAALAGFSIPTMRAFIFVSIVNMALVFRRQVSRWTVFQWGLVGVLWFDPFACLSAGFWLSFSAVLVLMLAFLHEPARLPVEGYAKNAVGVEVSRQKYWRDRSIAVLKRGLWPFLRAQWVIFVGLFWVLIFQNQPISLVSPVANLIAVPIASLILVPGNFLALFLSVLSDELGMLVWQSLDHVMAVLWSLLQALPAASGGFAMKPVSAYVCVMGLSASLLFILPLGRNVKVFAGLLAFLTLVAFNRGSGSGSGSGSSGSNLPHSFYRLSVLDVGQGLSAVVESPSGESLVYDVGAKFSERFDVGRDIVFPFLQYRHISQIDRLVVSHNDQDHRGGLEGLLENITAKQLFFGQPPSSTANKTILSLSPSATLHTCNSRQRWHMDGATVRVLWPNPAFVMSKSFQKSNNRSCVLWVEVAGVSILITGDIEASVERYLIRQQQLPQNVDILIAPHHGSATSSTQDFVLLTRPRYVVFSAGYKNRFRHPHPDVIARYQKIGSEILSTAQEGAIVFDITDSPAGHSVSTLSGIPADLVDNGYASRMRISVRSARRAHRRLWYD